jgi:phosphonate transport system substrate-binding protein
MTAVLIAIIGGGGWYYLTVQLPMQTRVEAQEEALARLSGLLTPVSNTLDPAYTDTNGDLVAVAPTDPSKWVDPPVLHFSYNFAEDQTAYKNAFADFMTYLSKATGKPVEYAKLDSVADQLGQLKHNELDVTSFNTGNVPIAVCAAGFVPVGCLGSDKGGSKLETEIIARTDSGIQTVSDLKGHELALTDPSSNSGYKAPLVLIKSEFGLYPGRDFGVRYSGGHEESIKGLADGTYQVIAVASDVLNREIAAGAINPYQYKVIYTSASFPTAAFGYAYNLKPDLAAKIRQAILDIRFSGTSMEKFFAGTGQDRIVPVIYKDDWALIRSIDDQIGFAYKVK